MAKSQPVKSQPQGASAKDGMSEAIGRRLRAVYDETLNEPVPAKLSDLIEQLSKKSKQEQKR